MSRANKRWFHKKTLFQRRKKFETLFSNKNMFSNRKSRLGSVALIWMGIVCIAAFLIYIFMRMQDVVRIDIEIPDTVILQDEMLPDIAVYASCEKDTKMVREFMEVIHAGDAYQVRSDGDLSEEGNYELYLDWNEETADKISGEWKKKIKINIENGTLTVKNKLGEWEENKFKKWDGTYAVNEFVSSKGNDYFFDNEGNKVTGEYQIYGYPYYFGEDGVFDMEKNKIHPGKPMIALTFDDGPGVYTEELLSVFEENDSRATFFVLGQQAESFPASIKKMKEIGCEIGNHTYEHRRLTELSEEDMKAQISKTNQVLKEMTGEGTKLVRPTYGAVDSAVRKYVKYPLIMWSLDTEDWKLKDSEKIVKVILSQVKDGDIVLMHDIHDFTVEAMRTVVPKLVEEGYQLVTVSELASVRGVTMENGEKYFKF